MTDRLGLLKRYYPVMYSKMEQELSRTTIRTVSHNGPKKYDVELYVDGACKGNPGPGGWGCYAIYMGDRGSKSQKSGGGDPTTSVTPTSTSATPTSTSATPTSTSGWWLCGGEKSTTNNRMELTALIRGLNMIGYGNRILVLPDSTYCIGALISNPKMGELKLKKDGVSVNFTGYMAKWIADGWKTGKGERVNKDLWLEVIDVVTRHLVNGSTIDIQWVKGHSTTHGNNMADHLSNEKVPVK